MPMLAAKTLAALVAPVLLAAQFSSRGPGPAGPRAPASVSGRVVLEGGGTPNRRVTIYYCDLPVAASNKRGWFRFRLRGNDRPMLGGTRVGSGGVFGGCAVWADLPGFRSDRVPLSQGRAVRSDRVRIGEITLHPLAGFDGLVTSTTTLEAPKAAKRSFERGLEQLARPGGSLEKAAAEFERAVAAYPRFAEAWTALGETRLKLRDLQGAVDALRESVKADPAFPRPYRTLVQIYMMNQNLEAVLETAPVRLRLNPADDHTRYFLALASFGLRRYDEAEASAKELIRRKQAQRFPQVHQILGEIYADWGAYSPAAASLRAYLRLVPTASSAKAIEARISGWQERELIPAVEEP